MEVDDKKIFVGGLSWETTGEALKEYFAQFGEVTDSVIMMDSVQKKPRGFGFVTFRDPQSVYRALNSETPHVLDNKKIDPKPAVNQGAQKAGLTSHSTQGDKVKKVFVGGIPAGATEDEIRTLFGTYGTVTDVELKYDKATSRMRGFGFVTFDSEDDVEKLCQLKYVDCKEKKVEVKKAEPRYQGAVGGHMGGGGGSYGGSGKSYGQGFPTGYGSRGGGGSGSGGGQYSYGYGYGQGAYGQGGYGQAGFGQGGYGYPSGGYNQGFPQGSYGGGSYNQQGGFGYSTTQSYPTYQNYDSSGGRPGQQQVSGGGYQQDSTMYSQGTVGRGFPAGTDQYVGHSGASYGAGYGGGSDMPGSGNSYQYSQGSNGEKQSSGFAGAPRGQQAHPGAQYGTGFGGGR